MTEPMMSLAGKRVVVIGGTSGIGFAVALLARELGAALVIASSKASSVGSALERLPGATGDVVDLKDEASTTGFLGRLDPFDHLAITAGEFDRRVFTSTEDLDLALAREAFEVRFWGALAIIKHARHIIAPNGSVTLTSGMLAHRPSKGSPLPTAVVGAVEHLVCGLAVDLAPLRINAVCPGLTLTELITNRPGSAGRIETATAGLPLPRAASPAEAAAAYIYLMLNGYLTGQILPVGKAWTSSWTRSCRSFSAAAFSGANMKGTDLEPLGSAHPRDRSARHGRLM
ncbi:MAG: SDR family oxidoreductase [Rhizomicrobium sp.]